MKPGEFPKLMGEQEEKMGPNFASVSETLLETQETQTPGGGMAPLGLAILNGPFKWMTAYKLQLFLYAKAAGVADINTANAWAGVDRRPAATT